MTYIVKPTAFDPKARVRQAFGPEELTTGNFEVGLAAGVNMPHMAA
ncbi:MAG: hypothetical protein WA824_08585 [Candidatus Sulfotelmatobacter sp.]